MNWDRRSDVNMYIGGFTVTLEFLVCSPLIKTFRLYLQILRTMYTDNRRNRCLLVYVTYTRLKNVQKKGFR